MWNRGRIGITSPLLYFLSQRKSLGHPRFKCRKQTPVLDGKEQGLKKGGEIKVIFAIKLTQGPPGHDYSQPLHMQNTLITSSDFQMSPNHSIMIMTYIRSCGPYDAEIFKLKGQASHNPKYKTEPRTE